MNYKLTIKIADGGRVQIPVMDVGSEVEACLCAEAALLKTGLIQPGGGFEITHVRELKGLTPGERLAEMAVVG